MIGGVQAPSRFQNILPVCRVLARDGAPWPRQVYAETNIMRRRLNLVFGRPVREIYDRMVARTEQEVRRPDLGPCWIWKGEHYDAGYARIRVRHGGGRRSFYGHRISLQFILGRTLQVDLCACHKCDVKDCVNPDHLFEGTRKQNSDDMVMKGRSRQGSNHTLSKITEDDVRRIRLLYQPRVRGCTMYDLARLFGLSPPTICNIIKRDTWKHVK